jgi:hypothetical protein
MLRSSSRAAWDASGEITAAALYEALLSRWLEGEHNRMVPRGNRPLLQLTERWKAMGHLAELLWQRTERTVPLGELSAEVQAALEALHGATLDRDQATRQVGSGTLLVRDEFGNFGFIHQSVMEWLVADRAAQRI